MSIRTADAIWLGTLKEGNGTFRVGSGVVAGAYTWATRFAEAEGTNPEELIGAAHASCFSMFLSAQLTKAEHPPVRIHTTARVHLGEGPAIHTIELETEGEVPGIDQETFAYFADRAKTGCPVSKALTGVEIKLTAKLV